MFWIGNNDALGFILEIPIDSFLGWLDEWLGIPAPSSPTSFAIAFFLAF